MLVDWVSEGAGLHTARCALGAGRMARLLAEDLGERGWGWQAWGLAGCRPARRGVADSLAAAKAAAELELMSEPAGRGERAAWGPGRAAV